MQLPPLPEKISNEIFQLLTRKENEALIDGIAVRHQLHEDQVFRLSAVVGSAVTGTLPLNKLAQTLAEELGTDPEKTKQIALSVLLDILYPYWPFFPDIDAAIRELGGEAPKEKPAMPKGAGEDAEEISYADVAPQQEKPELFGGMEIPAPPKARIQNEEFRVRNSAVLERDVAWTPPKNVAKPTDVAKLLEKNLIKAKDEVPEPKMKGNVVDLSQE